ncbi:coxsackievirus and adenovirus receptor homolog isoform X2 [Heterodontus francisci]|uniref:coxsackievirus and adenovirus receptor homolog isoform X2 n=1 Tax=Heterodontus francisci TaxID=7792 RepID=UPI00355AEB09
MMYRNYSLITSFFLCFTADTAAPETKNYSAIWRRAGDKVILPCKYSPRSNQTGYLDIEWWIRSTNNKESYKMILTLSGGKVYPQQQRFSFASENGSEGDASLYFESLVVADSGIYECKVKVEGRIHQITWSLTVRDNQNATQSASATSNIPVSQYNTTQLPSINSTISSQHTPTGSSLNETAPIVIGVCGFIIFLILLVIYLKLKMKAVRLHRTAVNTTEQLEDFLSQTLRHLKQKTTAQFGDELEILPCKYSPRSNQTGYLDIEWWIRSTNNKESYKMLCGRF